MHNLSIKLEEYWNEIRYKPKNQSAINNQAVTHTHTHTHKN